MQDPHTEPVSASRRNSKPLVLRVVVQSKHDLSRTDESSLHLPFYRSRHAVLKGFSDTVLSFYQASIANEGPEGTRTGGEDGLEVGLFSASDI